ncbi:unnamed protein product [Rotaria sordida]|uniref:TM2 domain-containing protein n=1 Tax=Rotaria sordida TaxID=392033 RepID=A0A813W387_9BILA|nr:unnamed protein product [Rotaria sordida]CAF0850187.1 unnamed protein product [Rotaria sordida]
MVLHILSLFFFINLIDLSITEGQKILNTKCIDLLVGQYRCQHPKIDDQTQEPQGCERHHFVLNGEEKFNDTAPIICYTAPKITCQGGIYNETIDGYVFEKRKSCRWTNGKYYRTTLILSLFLGIFGIDRIYLGYYVSGLLKLFTCGFMLVGALVDFLLIALQVLTPADGSHYIIDYYGPRILWTEFNENRTYLKPQTY